MSSNSPLLEANLTVQVTTERLQKLLASHDVQHLVRIPLPDLGFVIVLNLIHENDISKAEAEILNYALLSRIQPPSETKQ